MHAVLEYARTTCMHMTSCVHYFSVDTLLTCISTGKCIDSYCNCPFRLHASPEGNLSHYLSWLFTFELSKRTYQAFTPVTEVSPSNKSACVSMHPCIALRQHQRWLAHLLAEYCFSYTNWLACINNDKEREVPSCFCRSWSSTATHAWQWQGRDAARGGQQSMGQDSIHSVGGVAPLGGCRVALVDGSRRWLKLPSPFFVHHASAASARWARALSACRHQHRQTRIFSIGRNEVMSSWKDASIGLDSN